MLKSKSSSQLKVCVVVFKKQDKKNRFRKVKHYDYQD